MTKMTYAIAIDNAINTIEAMSNDITGFDPNETIEKLSALKEQLAKRSKGGNRKPTKTQRENAEMKEDIFAYVSENGAKRAGEVAVYFGVSGQKASALLNQLVKDGNLEKVTEKKVTYFRVAEGF